MSRQDLFDRIVRMTHKAALGDVQWTVPASMINEIIRTSANNLANVEGWPPGDHEILFAETCFGTQRRRDVEARYFKHFFPGDEAVPRIRWLPDGQLTPTGDLYTEQEKKTSRVYNGSRKIRNGLYVRLDGWDGSHIVWSIADSTEPGKGWSSTQIEMLECLLPHVRRFVRVRGVLADARGLGSSFEELLDNGRACVMKLDRSARIVAANDRARALFQEGDGLSNLGGFLKARMARENDELQSLLARALPSFGTQPSAGSMVVSRPPGRTRLAVHVTPVTGREWDRRGEQVAALVLVVDPQSSPRIDAGLVARALNLTPAESQLATMVASGQTVRDIAAATGRTEGTVRWHLKQIFRKQGISRQSDLVRRVLSLEGLARLRGP